MNAQSRVRPSHLPAFLVFRAALHQEAIRTEYASRSVPLAKPTLRVFSWEGPK